jgi:pimeloyl-ACP methyl ester carboxylesterase
MSMGRVVRHLSVGLVGLTTIAAAGAQQASSGADGTSQFLILLRGARIGSETVTVSRTGGSIVISSRGHIGAPLDLTTNRFEMTYGLDWQPRQLTIDATLRDQPLTLATTFGVTTAVSDMVQGERRGSVTHDVSTRAVVLPPSYFAAYEILAARLSSFQPGARIPVYVPPEGEITATVNRITPRRVISPGTTTELIEYDLTLDRPAAPMSVIVSVDDRGRLAKVVLGEQGFAAVREDISTVMSREERVRNTGDADVFIPGSGFSIAATITVPPGGAARKPAVILVGGPGQQGRDATRYGVPIFGLLAGQVAEAGYVVVRFDPRGNGQSGGRTEHAGIEEYAGDVLSIVQWLRRRPDVDPDRMALVSHAEGSAVAITAAARERRIVTLALLSAPGLTGRETVLAQQQQALDQLTGTPAEREARVSMQVRVIDAVISGKGWEAIPPDVRRQADTPWFRTWLLFDPAVALRRVRQPILILHGALDREVPPSNGDRLEEIARARKNAPPTATRKVVTPGVNHLLLPATTGQIGEYEALSGQTVSPEVGSAVVAWLNETLPRRR